jgi:hypothetical protein
MQRQNAMQTEARSGEVDCQVNRYSLLLLVGSTCAQFRIWPISAAGPSIAGIYDNNLSSIGMLVSTQSSHSKQHLAEASIIQRIDLSTLRTVIYLSNYLARCAKALTRSENAAVGWRRL